MADNDNPQTTDRGIVNNFNGPTTLNQQQGRPTDGGNRNRGPAVDDNDDRDYRPTRRARTDGYGDCPNDNKWGAGKTAAVIVASLFGVGAVSAIAIALVMALSNVFTCDSACMLAKKDMAVAHETTLRAMANSSANAQAGFGNNDASTQQTAVLPRAKYEYTEDAPDVRIRRAPAASTVSPPAPAAALPPGIKGDYAHPKFHSKEDAEKAMIADGCTKTEDVPGTMRWHCPPGIAEKYK
jgi:hypothetical protein